MPIYEYSCKNGCPQWEVIQKISEPHIEKCPVCEQNTAQRLISTGGFVLKGRGFHRPTQEDIDGSI